MAERRRGRHGSRFRARGIHSARWQAWRYVTEALGTSLWFLPMLMLGASLALVAGAQAVDDVLLRQAGRNPPAYVYVSDAETARELLSTLLASMMTMTSLVFSITMVVLTLAANQFGPRLIRNFMALPLTQLALGTFVMTSGYCLLSLTMIGSRSPEGQQPFATVSLAVALAFISIVVLVVFLHALARSIVSETVIRRVGVEVDGFIEELEPLDSGEPEPPVPTDPPADVSRFGPSRDGYVQAVRLDELLEAAVAAKVTIHLAFRPGDYVVTDGTGIIVAPAAGCTEELRRAALAAVVIGAHRTPTQDPEFSIRHLVEIAVRALSPGINDPYTASAVIDQLSGCLSRLMGRQLPSFVAMDDDGTIRVVCPGASYSSLIGAAFNQIRQNAAGKPMVLIHLIEAIGRIGDHARLAVQRQALLEQLKAILCALDDAALPEIDRKTVRRRAEAAGGILGAEAGSFR